MNVVAYTYNADTHCPRCMLDYASQVPYGEWVWLDHDSEDERYYVSPGIFNLLTLVEDEIIRDSEGNAIHPVFDTDEWYVNDVFEGRHTATLACSDCGFECAEWEAPQGGY